MSQVGLQLIQALGIYPFDLLPISLLVGAFVAVFVYCVRHRPRHGACSSCGYSLDGLEDIPTCPECGHTHKRTPNWDSWYPVRHVAMLAVSFLPFLAMLVFLAIHRSLVHSHDIDLLSAITSKMGTWGFCTLGAFGFTLVHAYSLMALGVRRLGIRWSILFVGLAVFGNWIAIVLPLLVDSLST